MDIGHILAERYRIDRVIGHGGMGDIYLGTDLEQDQLVAIKHLKRELIEMDKDVVDRFLRESEIQKKLKHPSVVNVHNAFSYDDDYFIVMDYVSGGTLSTQIKETYAEGMPIDYALELSAQLAGALQLAHEKGVIHRDLKPANVLMSAEGKALLTDFGAARIEEAQKLTVTGMVIGTYAYMSPESCRGETVDGRADVWSFGVMLFEMLTGVRPFGQSNPMQLMLAIMREPPADIQRINPDIPDQLADLIYRMLAKDINRRIPSMALIKNELSHMLEDGVLATHHSSVHTNFFMVPGELLAAREVSLPEFGPLIGRESERDQLVELIKKADSKLVTLQGSGGIGKTHLAVEVAKLVDGHFDDGLYFVDLTNTKQADHVIAAIAAALNFQFFGSETPLQQLSNYLTNKNLLLIIDNFEQVVSGAELLSTILKDSPEIQIVLTSRERVNLRDELTITLDGLPQDDAYSLFIQTARRLRSDFSPSADGREAIGQICKMIDGLPLAIELAAGWVNMLTPGEIVEEMAEGIDFLETTMRDVPERHRSIRAISENSWKLMSDSEREALRRLSVFRGGFRRDAVRKVVGASLLTLNSLIDKSLLRRSPESGLYSMQELLRLFAAEKLDEVPAERKEVREAHARHYFAWLKTLAPELIGGGQVEALGRIDRRLGNIQAALNTAISMRDEGLIEIWIDSMYWFYLMRGRQQEGVEAIRRATFASTMTTANGLVQVKMMTRLGAYSRFIGEFDSAQAILQEGLKLAREIEVDEEIAFALVQLGAVRPDQVESPAMWQEAYQLTQKMGGGWLMAEISNWLAYSNFEMGNIPDALEWLEKGMEERRRLQDSYGLAIILTNLGYVNMQMGDLSKAKKYLQEGLEINTRIGNFNGIGAAWNNLAYIALGEGHIDEAEDAANQALIYYDQSGNQRGRGEALGNLIGVALHNKDFDTADDICLQCIKLFRSMDLSVRPFIKEQGRIALAQNDLTRAQKYFVEALNGATNSSLILNVFGSYGELLLKSGEPALAAKLLDFVISHSNTEPEVRDRAKDILSTVSGPHNHDRPLPTSLSEWSVFLLDLSMSVPA